MHLAGVRADVLDQDGPARADGKDDGAQDRDHARRAALARTADGSAHTIENLSLWIARGSIPAPTAAVQAASVMPVEPHT
jgi:hypothetical protein